MPEPLLLATPIGLKSLGSDFDPNAPFTGCRICGDLLQHEENRICYEQLQAGIIIERRFIDHTSYFIGPEYYVEMLDRCTRRRKVWVKRHNRQKHSTREIASF